MTAADFKSIRESLGLTKAGLARRLGVSWQQVWLIESDRVYIREVYQLALRGLQYEKMTVLSKAGSVLVSNHQTRMWRKSNDTISTQQTDQGR